MTTSSESADDSSAIEAVGLTRSPSAPLVILVEPQLGENIGAAARAMANFGLTDLRLVRPRDGWPSERARANASGADLVIDAAHVFESVAEAAAALNFICATTARSRGMMKPSASPEEAAREMRRRIVLGERCGILFGPERSGLDNDDVALADWVLHIPTAASFSSLNLAQAVLILGYEWLRQADALAPEPGAGSAGRRARQSTPAARSDTLALFEHLESELDQAGFLWPSEKRPAMTRNLRNMILRMSPTDQDVRTLRGVVSALTKHARSCRHRS